MPFQLIRQDTLIAVCQALAELISLPAPVDPAGSQDPAVRLMVRAVNLAAQEMLNGYEWPEFTCEGSILVSAPPGTAEAGFDLPDDFFRFIDQTQWNAAVAFPSQGPVSPQGWSAYLATPVASSFTLTWQMRGRQIWFLNPPVLPGQTFNFMYLSQALVIDANDPTLTKNAAVNNGDRFLLDTLLLALVARVKWLEAKGFDTTAATRDMLLMWDTRVGARKGAAILNMATTPCVPLISTANVPEGSVYGMG